MGTVSTYTGTSGSVYGKICNPLVNKHTKTFVNVLSLGYVLTILIQVDT